MPGMDGFATCRNLKENPKTRLIPVIFLTAATDIAERLEGFAVGGVDYISKPFNEQEVLARVGVHLERGSRATLASAASPLESESQEMTFDAVLFASGQKILRQSISCPPSLDGLALQLGTNRRRVNEVFHAFCGLPAFGWLREERLRQAHYLVASTDTPISQIAEYLGYSTPANFAKAFRERYLCPPRVLRQEMQMRREMDD
jgi:transcriptional regulator GlxA family with amidase domain